MKIETEQALMRWAASINGRPFAWGQCDCNTVALEWLGVVTGDMRLLEQVRGRYKTELGAARFFKKCGLDWTLDLPARFKAAEVRPGFATVGDFIITARRHWQACHVCLGVRAVVVTPERGAYFSRMDALSPGFRVFRLPNG